MIIADNLEGVFQDAVSLIVFSYHPLAFSESLYLQGQNFVMLDKQVLQSHGKYWLRNDVVTKLHNLLDTLSLEPHLLVCSSLDHGSGCRNLIIGNSNFSAKGFNLCY